MKQEGKFVFIMRVRDSKNLKYDKIAKITTGEGDYDRLEFQPGVCVLESFERMDDTLVFHFRNKTYAIMKAQNVEGGCEIDLIEKKLPGFLKHHYEEVLDMEIGSVE